MVDRRITLAVAVSFVLGSHVVLGQGRTPVVRVSGGDCRTIQSAIDSLPAGGGEVVVEAGTYVCDTFVLINRDSVVLRGEGPATRLRLADHADSPVLVIGESSAVPTVTRSNILVADLAIDGNRANQTEECYKGSCLSNPLRNNGITLRRVADVTIENVTVCGARSGGVVTERVSRRVTIRGLRSYNNHFDGFAGYETEDSVFSDLQLFDNGAAGMSLDNGFWSNVLSDVIILRSGTSGVFMRDVHDNVFTGVRIRSTGTDGVFCAQDDANTGGRCIGNTFVGLVVSDTNGAGFRLNDATCVNNSITGAQFIANRGGCVSEANRGLVQTSGVLCR